MHFSHLEQTVNVLFVGDGDLLQIIHEHAALLVIKDLQLDLVLVIWGCQKVLQLLFVDLDVGNTDQELLRVAALLNVGENVVNGVVDHPALALLAQHRVRLAYSKV